MYTRTEILELENILLPKSNSMCCFERIELEKISRKNNEIFITGGGKTISTNIRSIHYLNTKTKNQIHPFNKLEFKKFETFNNNAELIPRYSFEITIIKEASSNVGFAITFSPLIPTTKEVFLQFWYKKLLNISQINIPFNLGTVRIKLNNGNLIVVDDNVNNPDFLVNLGYFNGNSSIEVRNNYNAIDIPKARHTENSIYKLCDRIKNIK